MLQNNHGKYLCTSKISLSWWAGKTVTCKLCLILTERDLIVLKSVSNSLLLSTIKDRHKSVSSSEIALVWLFKVNLGAFIYNKNLTFLLLLSSTANSAHIPNCVRVKLITNKFIKAVTQIFAKPPLQILISLSS